MKYLFVHQNFPAQFQHIVRHIADQGGNRVLFMTCPNTNRMAGVDKAEYTFDAAPNQSCHPDSRDLEVALRRAETVARGCAWLKTNKGFVPDVIVGHHGWGELLNMGDVYPGVPVLGYLEFYYHTSGFDVGFDPEFPVSPENTARIRARNTVNHLALTNGGWGQTPTEFQLSTYPDWAQKRILLIREGVDLQKCSPQPGMRGRALKIGDVLIPAGEKLVTFTARSLEPYRGFHSFTRALPKLLGARKDVHVVIVGVEGASYGANLAGGSWKRHFMEQIRGSYDVERVHFLGHVNYETHLALLARSDAHVYLTYPFVASWSLREALACGCAVVGSDTPPVTEFIRHGTNGLTVPFFSPDLIAERILNLFEDTWLDGHIRDGARTYAERHLSMTTYLRNYLRTINMLATSRHCTDTSLAHAAAGENGC